MLKTLGLPLRVQVAEKRYDDISRKKDDQRRNERDTQAKKEYVDEVLRAELVVTREPRERGKMSPLSPLAGAVLESNRYLFELIYDTYEKCGGRWTQLQVGTFRRSLPTARTLAD